MKARPTMTDAEIEAWVADMRTRAPLPPMRNSYDRCTHGLPSTYRYGCRCEECKAAATAGQRGRRAGR